jgi:hypothetical protein
VLEDLGIPTVTVASTAFAPLAQVTATAAGQPALPIVAVPHPVGDRDAARVHGHGAAIAAECARLLTTSADQLAVECLGRTFPLPDAVMPR